jgi:hypothetical protein
MIKERRCAIDGKIIKDPDPRRKTCCRVCARKYVILYHNKKQKELREKRRKNERKIRSN